MRSAMDQKSFLQFYANTLDGYSKVMKRYICKKLEDEDRITFDNKISLFENKDKYKLFVENKNDYDGIIQRTCQDIRFSAFYEKCEFTKLYRYSVPLFYEVKNGGTIEKIIGELKENEKINQFSFDNYTPDCILDEDVKDAVPLYLADANVRMIKFVLQKMYFKSETFEQVEYRYPIVISIFDKFLDIRFDPLRYAGTMNVVSSEECEKLVSECISWLINKLKLTIYSCNHTNIINIINDRKDTNVVMYKQLMEMSSGAAAELTASENTDYVLPFVGEIRELIEENEELFNQSIEIKKIILQYLDDKEATANYPYIYIKWKKPVLTQSFIVKVIFDYYNHKYTLLQHNAGECKVLEMERMNDAIKYLCTSGSFVKGETI